MHEATTIPTLTSDTSENLTAAARRAESWFGEPFLQPDEDPLQALGPGTARRAALDDALAEMDAGLESPSAGWKVRYGLMLGLERVLTENPPHTAAGTELRRGPGLNEVVDAGAAAADLGFSGRQQLDAGNRLKQRTRLGAHTLPVRQVTGVVIDDPRANRLPRCARFTKFRQHLGNVAHLRAERLRARRTVAGAVTAE